MDRPAPVEMLTWSRERIDEHKWQRLQIMINYAWERSAFHRKHWSEAGVKPSDLRSIADLRKFPVVTKKDIAVSQDRLPPYGEALAVDRSEVIRTHILTGPSTSSMQIDAVTRYDAKFTADLGEFCYRLGGVVASDIVVNTRQFGFIPAGLFMQEALEQIGCNVMPLGVDQNRRLAKAVSYIQPTIIESFTTQCISIGRTARAMGIDPAKEWKIRKLFIGGEPGGGAPAVRRELADLFGNPSIQEYYGSAEARLLSMECDQHAGMHVAEPFTLTEVVDGDTLEPVGFGEVGVLLVTSLYRQAWPVIRMKTEDVVRMTDRPCACGLPFVRIEKILGKAGGLVRAGGRVQFPEPIVEVMRAFGEITNFQVAVCRVTEASEDRVVTEVESDHALPAERLASIREDIAAVMNMEPGIELVVEQVKKGSLPETARFSPLVDRRTGVYV